MFHDGKKCAMISLIISIRSWVICSNCQFLWGLEIGTVLHGRCLQIMLQNLPKDVVRINISSLWGTGTQRWCVLLSSFNAYQFRQLLRAVECYCSGLITVRKFWWSTWNVDFTEFKCARWKKQLPLILSFLLIRFQEETGVICFSCIRHQLCGISWSAVLLCGTFFVLMTSRKYCMVRRVQNAWFYGNK